MKFVLVGAAGFVAPRHYRAIKETGNELIACLDPHDSVGILDSYFPNCQYFSEFERFDRFCSDNSVDYVSICSPNYLHDAHCRFGLRIGANVICEKPLVLNPHNLERLSELEQESSGQIYTILQLRLSEAIKKLVKKYQNSSGKAKIIYYTPRGDWYHYSWKTNLEKSGGLFTNIGIHLFDVLLLLFGSNYSVSNWNCNDTHAFGQFRIGNFIVDVDLSIEKDKNPTRKLIINDEEFDLSKGFTDLHTLSYQKILDGSGFGLRDALPSIALCSQLRSLL